MHFSRTSSYFFLIALFLSLGLSGCWGGGADFDDQFSDEGLTPEAYLPGDVGMVLSYSLRNDDQLSAIQAIQEKMGDKGDLSQTIGESFNVQFADAGLDYEKDLLPAFGSDFRWVYGARPGEEETEVFSVTTLENPEKLVEVFDTLSEAGSFEKKVLSDQDVYVNEDEAFYAVVHEDLLFVASDAQNLVDMVEQDESDSLWGQDNYQEAIESFGQDFVLFGILFPEHYADDLDLMTGLSVANVPAVIDRQSLVVRAEESGLRFEIVVQADKEKAKEFGFSFDAVPRSEAYLFGEVPSADLMAYFESYGMKQTLEEADKLGDESGSLDQLRSTFQNYFGMDFDEEFLSFFDKGYALSVHQNEGLVPGVSIFVDVSSDEEHATELVNKMDGQLSGLITVFEESLPGALSKDTVTIEGGEYSRVILDLTAIPRTEGSPIPSVITEGPIQLLYGVNEGRMLISTAQVWEEGGESIEASDLYKKLDEQLESVEEGLILVDANGLADFVGTLRALREQLGLEVSDQALQMEDFFEYFYGAIARSQTGAYSSTFTGYLMLAE